MMPSVDTPPRTILVTGGAGFLGINLIRFLLERGYAAVSLDIAPFASPDVQERVRIVTGDIRDERAVTDAMEGVDAVIHAAALSIPRGRSTRLTSTGRGPSSR